MNPTLIIDASFLAAAFLQTRGTRRGTRAAVCAGSTASLVGC